uniref:DUF6817 domain-containing protein n=1 Tax=Corethron hystrix TaxID=216773 RepID=A0A7S1FWQ6_9STRA|mmetsp:Transcript_35293/g.81740  ORF Transcript_35293/g.81740 Transcript_35293/m.81740 type:complete len:444 (+) Transcript_35293:70-1401(+)
MKNDGFRCALVIRVALLGWAVLGLEAHNVKNGSCPLRNATDVPAAALEKEAVSRLPSNATDLLQVKIPSMPSKIEHLLHERWDELDFDGRTMLSRAASPAAYEFPHARDTFVSHLRGTFGILAAWDQPPAVKRTGLLHTAYSGDLFQFYLYDAASSSDRAKVASVIGSEAEALTWLFGTVNRDMLCNFRNSVTKAESASTIEGPAVITHRLNGTITMSERDIANILMVTIADYLDQMVDTNGWKDHHQVDVPDVLYPGDGKPAVALYWMSSVCRAIRDHLEVVPLVFRRCTEVLSHADETAARDRYWDVTLHEKKMTADRQIELLRESVSLNPHVGEPHLLLSQLYFRQGDYLAAATEARESLEKLYVLASAWDKRRSYGQWVGFARVMLLRANRRLLDMSHSLPVTGIENAGGLPLVSLSSLFQTSKAKEMTSATITEISTF